MKYLIPNSHLEQGPVVQRLDNSIHQINLYRVDSVIHPLNKWAQDYRIEGNGGLYTFNVLGPYLPSLFAMLIIRKVILDPFVYVLQCHTFLCCAVDCE